MGRSKSGAGRGTMAGPAAKAPAKEEAAPAPRLVGDDIAGSDPAVGQLARLATFLGTEFPDYALPTEGTVDAAIRLLSESTGVVGTWRQAAEEANANAVNALAAATQAQGKLDEALGRIAELGEKLDGIPGTLMGLGLDDYEPIEGEDAVNALDRFMLAAGTAMAERDAQIAELTDEGETAEDARKLHKAAVRNLTELFADLPDTAAITLRFAEGNEFIRQVEPIAVPRAQLIPVGSKVALDRRIEFPPGIASAFVNAAFLIAGRKTLRCEISALRIGGGAMAAIPAGFLEF